jgi:hypothetical protein
MTKINTDCKYGKWYFSLMKNAQNRPTPQGYTEKHHIIPKCFGGSDDAENIAILTPREHYVAHLLLTKIKFSKKKRLQMIHAYMAMSHKSTLNPEHRDYKVNSRTYARLREEWVKHLSDAWKTDANPSKNMSDTTKDKIKHIMLAKHQDDEYKKIYREGRKKMSENMDKELISQKTKEAMWKPEIRQKYLEGIKNRKLVITPEMREQRRQRRIGYKLSEETKRKISESHKRRLKGVE